MKKFLHKTKTLSALLALITLLLMPGMGWGQISVSTLGIPLTENFDGMGASGTAFIAGWTAVRAAGSGTLNATLTMAVTDGGASSGNIYNTGTTAATERAFGSLASGTTSPRFGASFANNTGSQITAIAFAGVMEQWRSGSSSAVNEILPFEYSFDATSLFTGTWVAVTSMDLVEKLTSTTVAAAVNGNLAANKTNISGNLSSLTWANGTTMWIRWTDADNTGSDGLYAIDDFSLTATGGAPTPNLTINLATLTGFTYVEGSGPSDEQNFTIEGANLTADISIDAPADYQISTGTGVTFDANMADPITLTQSGGTVASTTIHVRLKGGLSAGSYNSEVITASSTGADNKTVTCNGTVSEPPSITFYFRGPSWMNNNPHNPQIWGPYNGWASPPAMTYDVVPGWWSVTVVVADASAEITYQSRFAESGTTKYQKAFGNFSGDATFTTTTGEIWIDASLDGSFTWQGNDFYLAQNKITQDQPANEPSDHVTNISATANSSSAITVSWTDSDATSYLIKGSDVGYGSITAPDDGIAEANGTLIKNMASGSPTWQFTGLTPNTTYYFKIYPYNGTGTGVNYKTGGSVPEASTTTDAVPAYATGDFGFMATSGNWGTTNANWKQWDGSGWNTNPAGAPALTNNVFILAGKTCIIEVSGKNCKNLTIESGAKLYTTNTTMGTPRYVNVGGNITCDGTIGNGAGADDVISFNISGGITSFISGSGSFTANRVRRNSGAGILNLTIAMDIELRYNGDALYNATSAPDATQAFNVTFNEGKHVNLTGNGATPSAGYALKSVDFATIYGKLTVTGTLTNAAGNAGIVIKSTASGTGSLIHSTATIPASVERYMTGGWSAWNTGWHQISSPVAIQAISGFATGNYDFYGWDETTSLWKNYKDAGFSTWNGGTNFNVGQGYLISYDATTTNSFSGNLNVANVTKTNLTQAGAALFNGWHLLGNPFASAIKWNDGNWALSNVAGGAKIWHEGNKSYSDIAANGIIPSAQGFMIQVSSATNSITIPALSRTHDATAWYKSIAENQRFLLVASETEGGSAQESQVIVNPIATDAFDFDYDSRFLAGYAPMFYSMAGDEMLSTNSIPTIGAESVIPFGFVKNAASVFAIELKEQIDGQVVYLTDKKTSTLTNLSQTPVYNFTASEGDDANRFTLHFSTVGIDNPATGEAVKVYAHSGLVYINGAPANAEVNVMDITGRVILSSRTTGSSLTTLNVSNLPHGMYIVKINSGKELLSRRIIL